MPWKECSTMTERMKFVSRLLDGERMTDLCKEFGVSRKTGYKIYERFQKTGFEGIRDQSKLPKTRPNQTEIAIERSIIKVRSEHPTWGAPKIKAYLEKRLHEKVIPARSTIHAILERNDLVKQRKRRILEYKSQGTDLTSANAPNKIWCTDFKGQFKLGNKQYCYPLTVTDQFSRYLIACEALENNREQACINIFDELFEEYGLPEVIKSDNGVPFASVSYFGLSSLSVYWLRLGIKLERIKPGHPEQNGSHERMHKTLKAEATIPPSPNILSQQERFDCFRNIFNSERPHQALEMKSPADVYQRSKKTYQSLLEPLEYKDDDFTLLVSNCGSIRKTDKFRIYLGVPFAGYNVGVRQIDEDIWRVRFMNYELGFFDSKHQKLEPSTNPFLIKTGN